MKVDPKINHGCLGNVCFGDYGRADRATWLRATEV
jgi:hypothetical protein